MALYSYEIGVGLFAVTDPVILNGTTAVSGSSGSAFDTQFDPGDILLANDEYRIIDTITSASSMSVTAAFDSSGSFAGQGIDMTNVENLTVPVTAPKSTFKPWQESVLLQSGLSRALGKPSASWNWAVVSRAMRDQLRTFCPAKSANVYIRTRINDADAYKYFAAIMNWTDDPEEKQAGRRLDFKVDFNFLVEIVVV